MPRKASSWTCDSRILLLELQLTTDAGSGGGSLSNGAFESPQVTGRSRRDSGLCSKGLCVTQSVTRLVTPSLASRTWVPGDLRGSDHL